METSNPTVRTDERKVKMEQSQKDIVAKIKDLLEELEQLSPSGIMPLPTAYKRYPEGILSFKIKETGNIDTKLSHKEPDKYQKWARMHLEKFDSTIQSVKNKRGEILEVGMMTQYGVIDYFRLPLSQFEDYSFLASIENDSVFQSVNDLYPLAKETYESVILRQKPYLGIGRCSGQPEVAYPDAIGRTEFYNTLFSRDDAKKVTTYIKLLNCAHVLNGDWKPQDAEWVYRIAIRNGKTIVDDFGSDGEIIWGDVLFKSSEVASKAIQLIGEEELVIFFKR